MDETAAPLNPFDVAEASNYSTVGTQTVEALARIAMTGDNVIGRVSVTYLRILCADAVALQSTGIEPRRAVDRANDVNYPSVLAGVTTPDVMPFASLDRAESSRRALERNRRSNFARTAKSALAKFVAAGGQLEKIPVSTVTKGWLADATTQLRTASAAAAAALAADPADEPTRDTRMSVDAAFRRLIRAMRGVQATHPEDAGRWAADMCECLTANFPNFPIPTTDTKEA